VKKCWLARIDTAHFPASHVSFIRCRMSPQILPAGWLVTGPRSATLRFEEFGSTDLEGHPLDVSRRDPAGKQLGVEEWKMEDGKWKSFRGGAELKNGK
jgi:hypothetical protein